MKRILLSLAVGLTMAEAELTTSNVQSVILACPKLAQGCPLTTTNLAAGFECLQSLRVDGLPSVCRAAVESVLDVTVTANGSGNGGKGKGSGRGRGGKGSGRGRGGKGKGKGKRKKEVEEEMASAPVAPAEFKPAACSFGQERCTRELQASGSQCTYNSCVARSVPAPAASMQTTSKQTASTSPPMDPETVKNAAADGIRSIFAACPNLDCMLPSGNAASDFVELSKSLMCISKVDLAAPGVSEACTQLLGPIKAMQAQQQQVGSMYARITEACPNIPCAAPAEMTREAVSATLECFQSLNVEMLSETCRPVLGPLIAPQQTEATVDTTKIGSKQSREILAKFAALQGSCPSVTCDVEPVTDEALQASLACLGAIDISRLSPGCIDALKSQAQPQSPPPAQVTRMGPEGNVLYGRPRLGNSGR